MTWTTEPPKDEGYYWWREDKYLVPSIRYIQDELHKPKPNGKTPFFKHPDFGEWWQERIKEPQP